MVTMVRIFIMLLFLQIAPTFAEQPSNAGTFNVRCSSFEDFSAYAVYEDSDINGYHELHLEAYMVSVHWVRDGHEYRFSPYISIWNGFVWLLAFGAIGDDDAMAYAVNIPSYLLNPSIEYYLWQKYIPVSVGAGYNADWFLFSPGREFYFKSHVDLNVMFKLGIWFKLTGSLAYLVTDTYDLKHGPQFEFRLGI